MASCSSQVLSPIVKWGQTESHVFLTVHVTPCSSLTDEDKFKIDMQQEHLTVRIFGDGANGRNLYGFDINLYLPILPEESKWNSINHGIEIVLKKEYKDPWPRLSLERQRLPWAKFDFDRFQFDESDESVDETKSQQPLGMDDISGVQIERRNRPKKADEEDPLFKLLMNPLTLYMLLYNLVQFAGFLFIFAATVHSGLKHGLEEAYRHEYDLVIDQLAFVQILSILEILHAAIGWVRGGVGTTFMQVFGRNLALKMIVSHPHLHQLSTFYWLVVAWSSIEIVRYPFYLLATLQEEWGLVTYLRYTLWIPFYPIGFMCEGKMILGALSAIEENDTFSIHLPNAWNVSLHVPTFLKVYLLVMLPGFYMLMVHMYKRRKAKIGPNPKSQGSSWSFLQYILNRRALNNKATGLSTAAKLKQPSRSPAAPLGPTTKKDN